MSAAAPAVPLSVSMTCAEVYERMAQDKSMVALAVMEGDRPVGLADRISLISNFARQYWREIYAQRPITKLMDDDPLVVDAALPVEAVGTLIATKKRHAFNSGFIVMHEGRYWGIGNSVELLRRVADHALARARLLEAAQESISLLNRHLEQRIDERTQQLEAAHRELVRSERLSAWASSRRRSRTSCAIRFPPFATRSSACAR